MEPEAVLWALLTLWEELPGLVGPGWTDLFPKVERLLDRLQQTADPGERASLAADLVLLFREHPRARERLRKAIQEIARERAAPVRGGEPKAPRGPGWSELLAGLSQRLNPPVVTRYTDITAPRRLALGRRGVITVGLTRAPAAESEEARPLEVKLKQFLEVYLRSQRQDFEVIGEPVRRLPIVTGADTEPAVFYIKAVSLGTKHLSLSFLQSGVTIGTVHLVIEVSKEALPEEQPQDLVEAVQLGGPYAPPPDLEIRVTTQVADGQTRLTYEVHSPSGAAGFHHQPAGSKVIVGSPEGYQLHLMQKIEALAAGRDVDGHPLTPQEVEDKLVALGHGLYWELFPPEMRRAYRQFRRTARTLLITSDEPWIPWELIKPYDDSDPDAIINDDFLCVQFQMSRWLAGRSGGAGKIRVSRLVCVEAGQASGETPLPYAGSERQYLADMAVSHGLEDSSPNPATGAAVEALLDRGGVHLWHFAAHGNVDLAHPNESVIRLADGRGLRAEDIHGPRQTHIAQDRPLVFLNACRVGQQGWSLTRLGGWAAAWVDRCRCGAFIGPLWKVNDWLAYEFARAFYDALRKNQTIAQAAQVARNRVRELAPADPTWLAYSVYAHPNARVVFSAKGGGGGS